MKSGITVLSVVTLLFLSVACAPDTDRDIVSPNGEIRVKLVINNAGEISYHSSYRKMTVMENSRLGIKREDADFTTGLHLTGISETESVRDDYRLLYGKKSGASYRANKKTYHVENDAGSPMDIIIQVSDDGFAFRYYFPEEEQGLKKIAAELTGFNFPDSTRVWIQPRAKSKTGWSHVNPSYEEHYWADTLLSLIQPNDSGWVLPVLAKTKNCWIALTESWPDRDYCGSHLNKGDGSNELVITFPEATEGFTDREVYPESVLPWSTPWRIVTLGSLATLVESTLGTDLAKPPIDEDFSYVKPGRASWSWALGKDPSVNYDNQVRFIQYAADMGWEYCLIDVNWDTEIGWDGIKKLVALADDLNVGLILWYSSSGDWNTIPYHPKDVLTNPETRRAEFERISKLGIKGIKVDFFGGDGQSMMDYYQDILEDAHKYHLVVNCHGATLPRGLQRTWPNLVSMEAIRGFEFATFGQETADRVPIKSTIVPWTRNLFDPMDFTPVCFNEYDNNHRVTGNAAELAQAVLFLSGVQHYAETPEGMKQVPGYVADLMREIPVNWDETRFVAGYPGEFVALARRTAMQWYVAGINARREEPIRFSLPFIEADSAVLVTEGDSLRSFRRSKIGLDKGTILELDVKINGGFVLIPESGE